MLTLSGEKELDKTLESEVEILDYHTGKPIKVTLGCVQKEVVVFHDYLNVYRIPLDYSVHYLTGENISLKLLWDEQINKIYTKFEVYREIKLLRVEKIWYGEPSCEIWYEKDYIIRK